MKKKSILKAEISMEMAIQILITVYVCAMLFMFPLYRYKYYVMGAFKYEFFIYSGLGFLPLITLLMIINAFKKGKFKTLKSVLQCFNITDWFVIAYGLILVISFVATPYKSVALWGVFDWHMGIVSQMILIMIYFVVSRYFVLVDAIKYLFVFVNFFVVLIAVLNRFRLDPLDMYTDFDAEGAFLTTIGQPTWYTGYLVIVLAIGVFLYWNSKTIKDKVIYGMYIFVGYSSVVMTDADSAYLGLLAMYMVLFCSSFNNNEKFKLFLETVIICLSAFKIMGIFEIIFPDRAYVTQGSISSTLATSVFTWILLAVFTVIYIAYIFLIRKTKFHISNLKLIPWIVCIGVAVIAFILVVMIVCVTNGWIPDNLMWLQDNNYLFFDDHWGNQRGINWYYTVKLYLESSPIVQLIGSGPDTYYPYMYSVYSDVMNDFWGVGLVLCNAHNEWLNMLLTTGITGFIAYGGVFIAQFVSSIKASKNNIIHVGTAMAILAYMWHNFFCYQQAVCVPIIFIVLGYARGLQMDRDYLKNVDFTKENKELSEKIENEN